MTPLRIATRRSELAMAQAGIVRLLLKERGVDALLLPLSTSGDEEAASAAGDGKDRWIDAILSALRSGEADLAVHSAKDLPAEDPEDLTIGAVPERGEPHDVLVASDPAFLDGARPRAGARVGTSSLRRSAQLRAAFAGIDIVDLRGNVPTRLRKVTAEGAADIAVLAAAGLTRLGLAPANLLPLDVQVMVPAPGQGALAIQCRVEDRALRATLTSLDHRVSRITLASERALTRALGGDCTLPLGAIATMQGDAVRLAACVAMPDGSEVIRAAAESEDPEGVAETVAEQLRGAGADRILDAIRQP
ncbi:MAG: hydroxymethylbilane synthase [Actinomycetota bacterium]